MQERAQKIMVSFRSTISGLILSINVYGHYCTSIRQPQSWALLRFLLVLSCFALSRVLPPERVRWIIIREQCRSKVRLYVSLLAEFNLNESY